MQRRSQETKLHEDQLIINNDTVSSLHVFVCPYIHSKYIRFGPTLCYFMDVLGNISQRGWRKLSLKSASQRTHDGIITSLLRQNEVAKQTVVMQI